MKVLKVLACISIIVIAILGITACSMIGYMNEQTVTCKIEDKWIKRPKGNEDEIYLVNWGGTTYKVEDLLFKGKFNSADIYGNLKEGKTYEITVTGFRLGYFSEYQNINSYKEITE